MSEIRFWLLISLILTLFGCVTTPKVSSEVREKIREDVVKKYGSSCRDIDGSHVLSLTQNGKFLSMDLDWVSRADGTFLGQVVDPLGRSVAEWSMSGSGVVFSSKIDSPLKKVSVNELGFLTFEDQSLYLRADELSCLLNGFVPKDWLGPFEGSVLIWESVYSDQGRKIAVSRVSGQICGTVGPGGIIGWFARPIKFCTGLLQGEMSWGEQIRLEWRSLDEPGS
jgi:hypothetical protein